MRIAVAGGTGMVGRLVVGAAREHGHTPVVLARSTGADVTTGAGLDAALAGADVLVDVSNVTTLNKAKSVAFFEAATGNLLAAAGRTGVGHFVALSIVGVDRVETGYYAGKLRQEELALGGTVPATVVRATQFHEFAEQLLGHAVGPVAPVPLMLSQPVAARDVAAHLIGIATGPALELAPELAGPEELRMVPLVRRLLRARGIRKLVVPVPLPGAAGKAMRDGGLLPTGPGPRGTLTFTEWLGA